MRIGFGPFGIAHLRHRLTVVLLEFDALKIGLINSVIVQSRIFLKLICTKEHLYLLGV